MRVKPQDMVGNVALLIPGKASPSQHYDQPPVLTDERGIATLPDGKVANFKDPDGNVLSIGLQT